jgi:hypothetical protein
MPPSLCAPYLLKTGNPVKEKFCFGKTGVSEEKLSLPIKTSHRFSMGSLPQGHGDRLSPLYLRHIHAFGVSGGDIDSLPPLVLWTVSLTASAPVAQEDRARDS